jgi:hypothetical protein
MRTWTFRINTMGFFIGLLVSCLNGCAKVDTNEQLFDLPEPVAVRSVVERLDSDKYITDHLPQITIENSQIKKVGSMFAFSFLADESQSGLIRDYFIHTVVSDDGSEPSVLYRNLPFEYPDDPHGGRRGEKFLEGGKVYNLAVVAVVMELSSPVHLGATVVARIKVDLRGVR